MPNSSTIPTGSQITEAMISNYQALNPSASRSAAIAALHAIETGVAAPTAAQRGNRLLEPLISSYDQSVIALGEGPRVTTPAASTDVVTAGPSGTGLFQTLSTVLASVVLSLITAASLTITGTANIAQVASPTVQSIQCAPFTDSTTTPAALTMTDTTGTRVIFDTWIVQSTGTSIGNVSYTVGTSTDAYTTSTSPFVQTTLARAASGREAFTTTSTHTTTSTRNPLFPVHGSWIPGETITVKSSTSVNAGTVCVEYKKI